MRITNKIMQNNNLSNINTNKIYQDKLSNQMSTQKKISRPSEDPVVAIRALRLRSNVTEITQYYSKNIPDAESWINVTEDALSNLSEVITEMIKQCTKGSNGPLDSSNRQIILEQLKALGDEVYSTGDADYAGRYVFTGYRTDTSLKFANKTTQQYQITEQLTMADIDQVTKVNTSNLLDINSSNYGDTTIDDTTISAVEAYRIRLAYNNCEKGQDAIPVIQLAKQVTDADGNKTTVFEPWNADIELMHAYDTEPDPYTKAAENDDAVIYIPETGELLLGKNRYEELAALKDDASTLVNEAEIRVTYQKSEWLGGDLRPEHYFACESEGTSYNASYLDGENAENQAIEYDVGFNQTIRVNSTADQCFQHGIGRQVDDMLDSLQQLQDIEGVKLEMEERLKNATDADRKLLQEQYDAAEKAFTLAQDKCQKLFEKSITAFQGYLADTNLCITNCGTRSKKLELIENRMQSQKTTFETLKSENEDVDITEVAITLSSAELTYEAALMATGKIMQNTLLNYV